MADTKIILCIEDNEDTCELITFLLENEGFKVKTCGSADEALRLAKENRYSAIILDNRLDDISGVEICQQIRTYDKITPIIFFTASAFPKDREAGLAAGANAYLVKPNDFEKLVKTVINLINQREKTTKDY